MASIGYSDLYNVRVVKRHFWRVKTHIHIQNLHMEHNTIPTVDPEEGTLLQLGTNFPRKQSVIPWINLSNTSENQSTKDRFIEGQQGLQHI